MFKVLLTLGGALIIGIFAMYLLQINRYEKIERDSENEK
jgi:hypothetical protein